MVGALGYKVFPWGDHHGQTRRTVKITCVSTAPFKGCARPARRLHTPRGSNPRLRRNSELFIEITRFIWDANPSYEVYQEFTKRHFQVAYKVHELISAGLKIEKQKKQSAAADDLTDNTRHYEGGFFKRLFRRRSSRSPSARCEAG
jgi:hypothetical protein